MKIYLDLDGVLADYSTHFKVVTGVDNSDKHKYQEAKYQLVGTDFYRKIPKFANTDYIIQQVVNIFGEYSICSCPFLEDWDNSKRNKLIWIAENLPIQPKEVILTEHKYKYAKFANILVDDFSDNIQSFRKHGGFAIDFKNGIDDVDEMLQKVKLIKKPKTIIRKQK